MKKTVPTKYWRRAGDGRIVCELCPRFCHLAEGQRGMCFVRGRQRDLLVLTTYGWSSGFCVDPIEKKPLHHFLPGTTVLSFGTAGCNLACKFCQNWGMSKSHETSTLCSEASPRMIARAARELDCDSIAFTYNDPVVFHEYAIDTAEACRRLGIRNVAVTAGYVCPEPREEFYRYMDAANVDLKAFTEHFYERICGGRLKPVLDTLVYLKEHTKVWLEVTTLLIPGLNDSEKEADEMTRWVVANLGREVPLHFSAFHPDWKMRDRSPTPRTTLARARDIAIKNGLRYSYTGNVYDEIGGSTYCHECGRRIMGRQGYLMTEWGLSDGGRCRYCGAACAGVFQGAPRGRQPFPIAVDIQQFAS